MNIRRVDYNSNDMFVSGFFHELMIIRTIPCTREVISRKQLRTKCLFPLCSYGAVSLANLNYVIMVLVHTSCLEFGSSRAMTNMFLWIWTTLPSSIGPYLLIT